MDAPKLPIFRSIETSAGMHHLVIIRNKNITFIPLKPQGHTSVIQRLIQDIDDPLGTVLNRDSIVGELGLPLRPWFAKIVSQSNAFSLGHEVETH